MLHQCLGKLAVNARDQDIIRTVPNLAYCVVGSQSIVGLRDSVHNLAAEGVLRVEGLDSASMLSQETRSRTGSAVVRAMVRTVCPGSDGVAP